MSFHSPHGNKQLGASLNPSGRMPFFVLDLGAYVVEWLALRKKLLPRGLLNFEQDWLVGAVLHAIHDPTKVYYAAWFVVFVYVCCCVCVGLMCLFLLCFVFL